MITVKKNAIKYKSSDGTMKDSGVLCQVGTFGVDLLRYARIVQFGSENIPSKLSVVLENATSLSTFCTSTKVEEIDVTLMKPCINMHRFYYPSARNYALKKITLNFDTSQVTTYQQAFNLISYEGAEIIGELDFSSATSVLSMFNASIGLVEVRFKENTLKLSISLAQSNLLSDESIQSIIDGLADLTGQTAQTITFHADVKAKLTEEQIATITSKNWTLA